MHRLLPLLLIGCLALAGRSVAAPALVACGHPIYPPVSWAQDGQLTGMAPAVVTKLFGELGYEVQLDVLGNWKRCLLEAQQGNADIVVSAYVTQERLDYLSYAREHIIDDPIAVFVNRQRAFSFEHWDDLKGKTVGLLLGDSFGDAFDAFVARHGRIEHVSKGYQNFAKLALGRIDYMPLGVESGRLQSQHLGLQDRIQPLPKPLVTEHYYIAVRRDSGLERHLPYINQRLRQLRADGTLARLQVQYSELYLSGAVAERAREPLDDKP